MLPRQVEEIRAPAGAPRLRQPAREAEGVRPRPRVYDRLSAVAGGGQCPQHGEDRADLAAVLRAVIDDLDEEHVRLDLEADVGRLVDHDPCATDSTRSFDQSISGASDNHLLAAQAGD